MGEDLLVCACGKPTSDYQGEQCQGCYVFHCADCHDIFVDIYETEENTYSNGHVSISVLKCPLCIDDIESDSECNDVTVMVPIPIIERKRKYILRRLKKQPYAHSKPPVGSIFGEPKYSKASKQFNNDLEERLAKATEEEIDAEYQEVAAIEILELERDIENLKDEIEVWENKIEALKQL